MHSISPYCLRCFNPLLPGKNHEKYVVLSKVGQYDLFQLLESFISDKQAHFKIMEASKQVFRFQQMTFDSAKRQVYGWLQVGSYATKNDIIDINTGNVDFEKTQKHALIVNHYIHFFVPKDFNEGVAILHSFSGNGVKTLFHNLFKDYFNHYTKLNLQMNPLSYDKAMANWQDANAIEIKVTKFIGFSDKTDQLSGLGHNEKELVIKPPKKQRLGKLRDFYNKDSAQAKAVEVLAPMGSQVKTVVEMNGRTRTFRIGLPEYSSLCEIELDEKEVTLIEGNPELTSFHKWCTSIIKDYASSMYPGLDIKL